jgi:hypothetical protein
MLLPWCDIHSSHHHLFFKFLNQFFNICHFGFSEFLICGIRSNPEERIGWDFLILLMVPKLEKEHRLKYHLHLQNFFSTKID